MGKSSMEKKKLNYEKLGLSIYPDKTKSSLCGDGSAAPSSNVACSAGGTPGIGCRTGASASVTSIPSCSAGPTHYPPCFNGTIAQNIATSGDTNSCYAGATASNNSGGGGTPCHAGGKPYTDTGCLTGGSPS